MAKDYEEALGTYTQWAEGFSPESVERALRDQVNLKRGQLNDGDEYSRTTPAGFSRRHYDKIRAERDDLDYREWNASTGFSGVNRWPAGPGVESEGQGRRRARREAIDEGF